jgi:toxin-antitoxin system PIN domain toxin
MLLLDVNVLVYAHREDAVDHKRFNGWLQQQVDGDEAFGLASLVLSGFVRVVTHPRVFRNPTPIDAALRFAEVLRDHPNAVAVAPGPRHWQIFAGLCRQSNAKGNQVPDAYLAALAIETGSEWITADRGFSRYRGLRWRHPLD